jgi:hypothetical protein
VYGDVHLFSPPSSLLIVMMSLSFSYRNSRHIDHLFYIYFLKSKENHVPKTEYAINDDDDEGARHMHSACNWQQRSLISQAKNIVLSPSSGCYVNYSSDVVLAHVIYSSRVDVVVVFH